ncbi:MAG: hypothetical protein AAGE94_04575 [Acidobacteriota bacterium]
MIRVDWRRWAPTVLAGLAAAALGATLVLWNFSPRARPAIPDDDLPARFLDRAIGFDVVAWIPRPHQNLPALERSAGLHAGALRSAVRLASLPEPALPRFGRLAVPPSRSLAVATDLDGDRFAAAARVYAPVAWVARLAGRLSGNPWLAGGAALDGEGRRVEVAWWDGVWVVGSPSLPVEPPPAESQRTIEGPEPALLVVDVRRARPPLPTGRYRLRAVEDTLELRSTPTGRAVADLPSSRSASPQAPPAGHDDAGAFLLALENRPGGPSQALALFSQDPNDIAELPRGAVFVAAERPGGGRWRLPTESLLKIAGRDLHVGEIAGLRCIAGDPLSGQAARSLAPGVASHLTGARATGSTFALWLDLAPAAAEIGRLRRGLDRSPLAAPREKARWREAERLVVAISGRHDRLALEIAAPTAQVGGTSDEEPTPSFTLRLD